MPEMFFRGENMPNILSRGGGECAKDVIHGKNLTKTISRGGNVPKTNIRGVKMPTKV